MSYTKSEVLQYVEENDVKFIKLFFVDISGRMKSLAVQPSVLEKAFEEGISFDGSAVRGFASVENSDLFLVPDPSTLSVLPWRPQVGRVARLFCNVRCPGGIPFEADSRTCLQKVVARAEKAGIRIQVGTECEFYLFKLDENGMATDIPYDLGTYCDLAPVDRGENARRDIVLNLEQLGIEPLSSHHESGPGQNEIDFKCDEPVRAADNFFTFRNTVKTISCRDGIFASFNPKPIENEAGSGLHINISLVKNGKCLPVDSSEEKSFIQGILFRIKEITAFANPVPESYARLGKFEAPKFIGWSRNNRSLLIRIPAASGSESRFELRSPDPSCNLYIVLALLIEAGLEGIEKNLSLSEPCNIDVTKASSRELSKLDSLPETLDEALELAKKSELVRRVLPASMIDSFIHCMKMDAEIYERTKDSPIFQDEKFKRWIVF